MKIEGISIAIVFAYHFLYALGFFETVGIFMNPLRARAISLGLITMLVFIQLSPRFKNVRWTKYYKILFVSIILATSGYLVLGYNIFEYRVGIAYGYEIALGILAIIFVFESTRLTTGMGILWVAIAFLLYTYFAKYMPGFLHVSGGTIRLISGQVYMGFAGIYGVPIAVTLDYIFAFLFFGFVLEAVGGLKFFVQFASGLFGDMKGGSAKVTVVLNFFIGMVNGSTVAAVLLSGPLTIPKMREDGYSERFMGGLVASAADASQLMPPVMGAVAFVMAEFLQVPYIHICIAAVIPATLYYLCLFLVSDLEARRLKMQPKPMPERETNLIGLFAKNWHCLLGLVLMVALLISQAITVRLAIMISGLILFGLSYLRKETRPSFQSIKNMVRNTCNSLSVLAPICATAGIIIACVGTTSLDYKFSTGLSQMAGGNLLLILLFTTIVCLVLGMGIPTLPSYILVVLIVSPPLIQLGIPPIAVHMFVFYMSITAMLTPPVALNIYAVMPMVKSSLWPIGISAMLMGMARWVIPFLFVYVPALLMVGNAAEIIWATFSAVMLVLSFCFAFARYGLTNANWLEVFFALAGGVLISFPIDGLLVDSKIIGGIALFITMVSQLVRRNRGYVK